MCVVSEICDYTIDIQLKFVSLYKLPVILPTGVILLTLPEWPWGVAMADVKQVHNLAYRGYKHTCSHNVNGGPLFGCRIQYNSYYKQTAYSVLGQKWSQKWSHRLELWKIFWGGGGGEACSQISLDPVCLCIHSPFSPPNLSIFVVTASKSCKASQMSYSLLATKDVLKITLRLERTCVRIWNRTFCTVENGWMKTDFRLLYRTWCLHHLEGRPKVVNMLQCHLSLLYGA